MLIIVICILITFVGSSQSQLKTARELETSIFRNYTPKWRPAMIKAQKTIVNVGLYMRDINDVDEKQHTITIHGGIHLFWNDYRLKWSINEYKSWYLATNPWRVWKPDATVYNSFQPTAEKQISPSAPYTYNQIWLYYDGSISYYTVLTKTMTCVFDYTNFPFDRQKCEIVIGSWMYDYSEMDFQWSKTRNLSVNFEWLGSSMNRTSTSGWRLINTELKKKYWFADGTFVDDPPPSVYNPKDLWPLLSAEFILERHRPYFALLELTPLILTSFLTLLCFGIDSELVASGVLFVNLIVQGLCSWEIIGQLPTGGIGSVPKIVSIYGVCFSLTAIALLLHLIIQRIRTLDKDSSLITLITTLTSKPWMRGFHTVNALKIGSFGTDYQEIIELTNEIKAVNQNLNEQIEKTIWIIKKIFLILFALIYFIAFPATLF